MYVQYNDFFSKLAESPMTPFLWQRLSTMENFSLCSRIICFGIWCDILLSLKSV